jgi:hypothetical protein
MYYTSTTKAELEEYNQLVTDGENYSSSTTNWAEVIEHPNGKNYAIFKHSDYDTELTFVESLSADWFTNEI